MYPYEKGSETEWRGIDNVIQVVRENILYTNQQTVFQGSKSRHSKPTNQTDSRRNTTPVGRQGREAFELAPA